MGLCIGVPDILSTTDIGLTAGNPVLFERKYYRNYRETLQISYRINRESYSNYCKISYYFNRQLHSIPFNFYRICYMSSPTKSCIASYMKYLSLSYRTSYRIPTIVLRFPPGSPTVGLFGWTSKVVVVVEMKLRRPTEVINVD